MPKILIGYQNAKEGQEVYYPSEELFRHTVVVGNSGSGKTTLSKAILEEAASNGIPVLAFDTQGDIAAMAEDGDLDYLSTYNISKNDINNFRLKTSLVVCTPGSLSGDDVKLSPFPVEIDATMREDQRLQKAIRKSEQISAVIAKNESENEQFIQALCRTFNKCVTIETVEDLIKTFKPQNSVEEKIPTRLQNLKNTREGMVLYGSSRLDDSCRLGLDFFIEAPNPTETPILIISLNELPDEETQHIAIKAVLDQVYEWMLTKKPERELLIFLDEAANMVPPVKKPVCKDAIELLLRQGRKYNVGMIMATQNPGDLDQKLLAQASTWLIGKTQSQRDLEKIKVILRSISPDRESEILQSLPSLDPGVFKALSSTAFKEVPTIFAKRAITAHRVFTRMDIERYKKERYAALRAELDAKPYIRPGRKSLKEARAIAEAEIAARRAAKEEEIPEDERELWASR